MTQPPRLRATTPLALVVASLAAHLLTAAPPARAETPNVMRCELTREGEGYSGRCLVPCLVNALSIDIDGPAPGATCDAPPRAVNATLRPTGTPNTWLGTMEGKFPEDPTRFELLDGAGGKRVAKTPFGWFALTDARRTDAALTLAVDANKTLPPDRDDIRIIERARALVATEAGWNRADTRQCPAAPERRSVFCALTEATTEVSGGVHYRQPAMQAVREVLNEVGVGRMGRHRLQDYNNHPDTTLSDIHRLLDLSKARLEARFR